jgi:tetratricopeptide (TPR) repeat protein
LKVSAEWLATGREDGLTSNRLDDADIASRLGDFELAGDLYERLVSEGVSEVDRARALAGLGEVALRRGNHRNAVKLLEEALAMGALTMEQEASTAARLGRAYSAVGEYDVAVELYERYMNLADNREDALGILRFGTLLANVLTDVGDLLRAEELLGRALSVAEQARDPLDRARLWWTQARVHAGRGQDDIAARYARMALDLLVSAEQVGYAALAYQLMAHLENERGDGAAAAAWLDKGEGVVVETANSGQLSLFRLERARALLLLGDRDGAATCAMAAISHLAEETPGDAGRGYALLAEVFRELGDVARAQELYELAEATIPSGDSYRLSVSAALASLLEAQGRKEEAFAVLKRAVEAHHGVIPHAVDVAVSRSESLKARG